MKKSKINSVEMLIRSEAIYWIIVAQALVILPLLWKLPQWLWGLWALTLFWRYALQKKWVRRTAGLLKWALAGSAIAGWYLSFPHKTNTDAMVGLLVMSFILKTIECHTHKDGLLLIFIGFIAVAAQFLFSQTLPAGLYGGLCLSALLLAWQSLYLFYCLLLCLGCRHFGRFRCQKGGQKRALVIIYHLEI
jgi:protein-glutamine gamma-glutamyltransferase